MSEWKRNRGRKTPPCEGLVEVVLRSGDTVTEDAVFFDWVIDGSRYDILKWRKVEAPAPATEKLSAADILRHAAELIEERGKQRDQENGERSMAKTVQAFNAIYGTSLTEVQGWHFMELLKMVRSAYGEYVADDFDDKVAYAALAAEAASYAPGSVDPETGEIADPDDQAQRQVEQQGAAGDAGGFKPSAEELAGIHAMEMAEAGQQTTNHPRRERGGRSKE